jgi:hypothetical protein
MSHENVVQEMSKQHHEQSTSSDSLDDGADGSVLVDAADANGENGFCTPKQQQQPVIVSRGQSVGDNIFCLRRAGPLGALADTASTAVPTLSTKQIAADAAG